MSFSEQIRHPSGALDPERESRKPLPWLWWIVVAATLIYLGWRAGVFGKVSRGAVLLSSPANPHRWV